MVTHHGRIIAGMVHGYVTPWEGGCVRKVWKPGYPGFCHWTILAETPEFLRGNSMN